MPGTDDQYGLYQELAPWWSLISPPGEYAQDAATIAAVFGSADIPVRTVLDLGSGGGHVALHLKAGFSLTLVDISEQMLEVSRQLNPECTHIRGDMRTLRLAESFDAVLVHDAIDYITTQSDLRRVIDTAYAHCRPGGLAVFAPDHTAETFRAGTGGGGGSEAGWPGSGGRQASFRERTYDPDAGDDWIVAEYEFTLREADGQVLVVPEAHRLGSFRRETWQRLLAQSGFAARALAGVTAGNDGRSPSVLFTGRRPPARAALGGTAR